VHGQNHAFSRQKPAPAFSLLRFAEADSLAGSSLSKRATLQADASATREAKMLPSLIHPALIPKNE
jgi:hypothetical protein